MRVSINQSWIRRKSIQNSKHNYKVVSIDAERFWHLFEDIKRSSTFRDLSRSPIFIPFLKTTNTHKCHQTTKDKNIGKSIEKTNIRKIWRRLLFVMLTTFLTKWTINSFNWEKEFYTISNALFGWVIKRRWSMKRT